MDRVGTFRTQIVNRDKDILSSVATQEAIEYELRESFVAWAYDVFYFASSINYNVTFSPLKLEKRVDNCTGSVIFKVECKYKLELSYVKV